MHETLGSADNVVAVGQEAGGVGGGVGDHVEDVPDVFCDGEGGPLEGEAEGGGGRRDGDGEGAGESALGGVEG